MTRALITGITGQDGSYLAELLLGKGYEVHGVVRCASASNTSRIDHIRDRLNLHYGDLLDSNSLRNAILKAEPHEIYNLGGQSHVQMSFALPEYTLRSVGQGVLNLLEAAKSLCPKARIYQAGSSEMFGSSPPPQDETTAFRPQSPYAASKAFAHHMAVNYRKAHSMFIANGILFNHESPRRSEMFVTRKITKAAARIKIGKQSKLYLGNLRAQRDWGFARDYVEAMWLMLQRDVPDDYVIATGESYSVQSWLEAVFSHLDLDYREHVSIDPTLFRPLEVDNLRGATEKACKLLGWEGRTRFHDLVKMMTEHDLRNA